MRRKKILLFVQDGVGGAERMTALIGRNLNPKKYDVCFCLIERSVKSSIVDFIPDEIRKIRIPNNGVMSLMLNMAKVLFREKPDVVFSSVFNINNKILLLKWLAPHSMYIVRCDNYMYTYNSKQRKLLLRTYPKADILIAQTEEMGAELIEQARVAAEKVRVLHNPIDRGLIDGNLKGADNPYIGNGRRHLVVVGRFDYQKGYDLLVKAFNKAFKMRNDIELYILGDTSLNGGVVAETISKDVVNYGIADYVHLCGYKSNPYPYIKYADCLVLSSRWEGLPNVLIESLYLGTPVAAFKCIPIIERIVDDGVTGFLAERENVNELAAAMINTLKLGRVVSSYKSASINDFVELFKSQKY